MVYDLLNEFVEQSLIIIKINTSKMPYKPSRAAKIRNRNLYTLSSLLKSGSLNTNDAIYERAIVIIIIGLTIPALTAASPNIKAPRIDIVDPYFDGNLESLSLKSSYIISIINASNTEGKGTPFL